jgi:hypothetical protein
MKKLNRVYYAVCICAGLTLGGCLTSPASQPIEPPPAPEDTSAVQTIEAQLTRIAGTSLPTPDNSVTATPTPTETLPPTSTPLPSDTPQPSDTPEPTQVTPLASGEASLIELTPTLDSDNPKASLGTADWSDNFETGDNWPLYNDEHVNMQITNGSLVMTSLVANRKNPWDSWMVTDAILSDFYIELSATPGDCGGLDRYGMVIRANPEATKAYLFGFSCGGEYSLRLWNGEKLFMLQAWQISQFINKGPNQLNRLGLLARGKTFSLYANDNWLTNVQDETFTEGSFGIFTGAANTDNFSVQFDQMAYWIIPN